MTVATQHLLDNMARANNGKFQTQGHIDGAFDWCSRDSDFAFPTFGMNSMGAHYNPVSINIINSESKTSLKWSYNATCGSLVLVCMHCIIRRNCVEMKHVDSARRSRSKSRTRQGLSRIALPRRTQPN
jgi:hypothetical protein